MTKKTKTALSLLSAISTSIVLPITTISFIENNKLTLNKNLFNINTKEDLGPNIDDYTSANFGPNGTSLKGKTFSADGLINNYQPTILIGSSTSHNSNEYDNLKKWIVEKSNNGIMFNKPYSDSINAGDMGLEIYKGKDSSSIIVQIGLNKYINAEGTQVSNSAEATRPYFYIEITNLVPDNTKFDNLSLTIDYKKPLSEIILNKSQTEIIDLISKQIDNLKTQMWSVPSDAQITIKPFSTTDWTFTTTESGQLSVKSSINKYYDGSRNENVTTKEFTITVNGFPKKSSIITINKSEITIPGKDQVLPTSIDKEQLKQLILENKSSIFNIPYPNDLTISTIDDVEYSIDSVAGTISISSITFSNYNDKGAIETASKVETQGLILKGFKVDTTSTEIRNLSLQGVNDILASDYNNNLDKIKQAIIANIENPVGSITIADVDLESSSSDNKSGILTTTVVIKNNKAKVDGVPQEIVKLENKAFAGFKKIIPSESQNELNANDLKTELGINANEDVSKIELTQDFVDSKADAFKDIVLSQPQISQLPTKPSKENMEITFDSEIGKVTVSFNVNPYYDENGNLVDGDKKQVFEFVGFASTPPKAKASNLELIVSLSVLSGLVVVFLIIILFIGRKKKRG